MQYGIFENIIFLDGNYNIMTESGNIHNIIDKFKMIIKQIIDAIKKLFQSILYKLKNKSRSKTSFEKDFIDKGYNNLRTHNCKLKYQSYSEDVLFDISETGRRIANLANSEYIEDIFTAICDLCIDIRNFITLPNDSSIDSAKGNIKQIEESCKNLDTSRFKKEIIEDDPYTIESIQSNTKYLEDEIQRVMNDTDNEIKKIKSQINLLDNLTIPQEFLSEKGNVLQSIYNDSTAAINRAMSAITKYSSFLMEVYNNEININNAIIHIYEKYANTDIKEGSVIEIHS